MDVTSRKPERPNRGARTLRSWRTKHDVSQKSLAGKLLIWPNSLLELEAGRRIPTLPVAVALERIAGIPCRRWLQA